MSCHDVTHYTEVPHIEFESLAEDIGKDPKSLMGMLSAKGNPRADDLLTMVAQLNGVRASRFL